MNRFLFFIVLIIVGCNKTIERRNNLCDKICTLSVSKLEETYWYCFIDDECKDYLAFLSDSNFVSYSCETDSKSYGKYNVINDTIFIYERTNELDSLMTESDCFYAMDRSMYKIILEQGKMKFVEKWSFLESRKNWVKDNFVFAEDYLFIEETNQELIDKSIKARRETVKNLAQ